MLTLKNILQYFLDFITSVKNIVDIIYILFINKSFLIFETFIGIFSSTIFADSSPKSEMIVKPLDFKIR